MKKTIQLVIIQTLLFFPPSLTFAEDLLIIPNLFFSSRLFEYSVYSGGVKGTINSLGGSLTTVYQPVYLDLSGERNVVASEESTNNLLSTTKVAFDRSDFTATLGYAIDDSISIFSGYKYGKSTITALLPSPYVGGKISLEGKGLFIGAGGRWRVKEWGYLSFSAAYARMLADYKDLVVGTAAGDASGTSLVVQWKSAITKNLHYDLSLIRHDYYYENFDKFEWDISEQIFSSRMGLSYRF